MRIRERFNPRAPCGARLGYVVVGAVTWISTHAPLAGRDFSCRIAWFGLIDFNPRAPCGARRYVSDYGFQP